MNRLTNPVRRSDLTVKVRPRSHATRNILIVFGVPLFMMLALCVGAWVLH